MKKILISILFITMLSIVVRSAETVSVTYDLVDAVALAENTKQDILVIFGANYCGACNNMKNDILKNTDRLSDYIICFIDIEKDKDTAKEYSVKIIPDYLVLQNKIEIKRKTRYFNFEQFYGWLSKNAR